MGRLIAPDSVLGPMVKAFHGRLYFNLSQQRHLFAMSGFPAAELMRALGHGERIRPEDEITIRIPPGERLRCLPDMVRVGIATLRAPQTFRRHQKRMRGIIARLDEGDPRTQADREVWDAIDWWKDRAPDHIEVESGRKSHIGFEGQGFRLFAPATEKPMHGKWTRLQVNGEAGIFEPSGRKT